MWKFLVLSKYTNARPHKMWYVWILSPCLDDDCFQREIATSDRKTEGESRQTDRERGCSAPLPLPVQSISSVWLWWIMDVAIDRLAQLCSIDPLWRPTQTQFLSTPKKKYHHIFICSNQHCYPRIQEISLYSLQNQMASVSSLKITLGRWK